jgi:hypothetical protein
MEQVVVKYLEYLDVPISKDYFKKCMLSHPDYPSLLSLADTLERLGIDHQVGKLTMNIWVMSPFHICCSWTAAVRKGCW